MGWLAALLGRRKGSPLGRRGEALAARVLKRSGYRILERNLSLGDDEADLVALDPDGRTIVIVEVKTRAAADGYAPELGVHGRKQFRMNRLAARLQKRAPYRDCPFRFDAIAIILPEKGEPTVRHIPGAFESRW